LHFQRAAADAAAQLGRQQEFHERVEAAQARWAQALDRSLRDGVAESTQAMGAALQPVVETTMAGLAREGAAMQDRIAQAVQRQLEGLSAGFDTATRTTAASWDSTIAAQREAKSPLASGLGEALERFNGEFARHGAQLVDEVSVRLQAGSDGLASQWGQALAQQQALGATLAADHAQALAEAARTFERQSAAWVETANASHAGLQARLAEQDSQRLQAWREALATAGTALREDWAQAGAEAAQRHQQTSELLQHTAQSLIEQGQAQASATIAEVSQLVQTALAAPQAAADVIAELRRKLSDSMARDNAMLAERGQMLATLDTLLGAVNHAATEQRAAIDALVATSAELLERVGERFAERVEAETGRLDAVAAQVAAGTTGIASVGEAFGAAVQSFGETNEAMALRLQGIENALAQSLARSDEQLAYYVAQAREVIDLSMLAQRQIVEELRQVGGAQPA